MNAPTACSPAGALCVGYLVNQYPKVSHTFIRREILALERQGVHVRRYALRGWDAEVVDEADRQEQRQTRYVLKAGLLPLLGATWQVLWQRPAAAWAAWRLAWRMSRGSDRPWPVHLVYLMEACQLLAWWSQAGVQHVHAHFGTNPAEVALLARCLGGPSFSFTVHGPEEFDKPVSLRLADKAHGAAFVVAISSFGRSQLWRWLPGADWGRVQVVHCGLDADFLAVAPGPLPDVPRLVCIGRLCEQKGQLLLVEAAALLQARGVPFELVLAGDGEMRPQVEQAVARHGLQGRVTITGWISSEQVRAQLAASRALELPSFAEGLPVVVMEAMAQGRPVLTTTIAGIPELVRPGLDGWLFAPGDAEAAAQAMAECLASPVGTLQQIGRQARERVMARHHIDREVDKLHRLLVQAVSAGGPDVG